jgi:hypothetical protein
MPVTSSIILRNMSSNLIDEWLNPQRECDSKGFFDVSKTLLLRNQCSSSTDKLIGSISLFFLAILFTPLL